MTKAQEILQELYKLSGAKSNNEFARLSNQEGSAVHYWFSAKRKTEPTIRKLDEIANELGFKLSITIT